MSLKAIALVECQTGWLLQLMLRVMVIGLALAVLLASQHAPQSPVDERERERGEEKTKESTQTQVAIRKYWRTGTFKHRMTLGKPKTPQHPRKES